VPLVAAWQSISKWGNELLGNHLYSAIGSHLAINYLAIALIKKKISKASFRG
jgi:hypothetical protein